MSSQFPIAFAHEPFSKFGHVPIAHPTDARESSSTVPQVRSSPPHAAVIFARSLSEARVIAKAALGSVWQSVDGGSVPNTMSRSQVLRALALACTKAAEFRRIVALHLLGSAWALVENASRPTIAAHTKVAIAVLLIAHLMHVGEYPIARYWSTPAIDALRLSGQRPLSEVSWNRRRARTLACCRRRTVAGNASRPAKSNNERRNDHENFHGPSLLAQEGTGSISQDQGRKNTASRSDGARN